MIIYKIIKEVYDELTSFSFIVENDNMDNLDIRFKIMEPEYIPTGFKKIEVDELYTIRIISYENEKKRYNHISTKLYYQ